MKVGEMFVNLGIKGTEKSQNALGRVHAGLGRVRRIGLGAKLAIGAAIFGFQRLASDSMKAGTNMLNFSSITGLSTKKLQQWQHAARKAGIDSQSLQSSVESVQKSMVDMLMGKGTPEGMPFVSQVVGFDKSKADNAFYVLKKLQEYAQEVRPDVVNKHLSSFGVQSDVIAAMIRGEFNAENFSQAPIYTRGEIEKLNDAYGTFLAMAKEFKMALAEILTGEGMQFAKNVREISGELVELTKNILSLINNLGGLTILSHIFKNIGTAAKDASTAVKALKNTFDGDDSTRHFGENTWWMNAIKAPFTENADSAMQKGALNPRGTARGVAEGEARSRTGKQDNRTQNQNTSINQNFNFSENPRSPVQVGDEASRAARDALRQMSGRNREN